MPKSKSLQAPGPFLANMLEKYNLTPFGLSKDIRLSQSAVRLLVLGENRITVPVAFRLAKYFNTNPEFWLVMQMRWEIAEAEKNKDIISIVKSIPLVKKDAGKKAPKTAAAGKVAKKTAKPKKVAVKKKPAPAKKVAKKAVK